VAVGGGAAAWVGVGHRAPAVDGDDGDGESRHQNICS